jgi:hypothetical protein
VYTCIYADYIGYVVDSNHPTVGGWKGVKQILFHLRTKKKKIKPKWMGREYIYYDSMCVGRSWWWWVGWFTFGGEETRNRIGARYTRAKKPSSRSM